MTNNSGRLSRFLVAVAGRARLTAVAVAAVTAIASATAAASPIEAALIESISSNSRGLQNMDYVRAGEIIHLKPHETIVLSYKASCVREMITGGTVTVGIEQSQVQSGEVQRSERRCDAGKMELTGAHTEIAGRTFRGGLAH
jgi:hypothetical protein